MHWKLIFDNLGAMLELRSLTYLLALARRANYARAADDLGISQPALTRAIQSLERRLGMRLFDRDRSGVNPTPHGAAFIERAAALVENARDLERMAAREAAGASGRVRFGIAPMPARAILAEALSRQVVAAPDMTNEVVVRNVEALWPLLIAGDIEFFVSAEGQIPQAPPVRSEVLGTFPYGLIVRAGHPELSDPDSGPGSGPESGSALPVLISSGSGFQVPAGFEDRLRLPPHVVEDFETLAAMTQACDAIWICSPFAVREELARGLLQLLPARGGSPAEMRIVMYSLGRRSRSPAALALRDLFRGLIHGLRCT
jgi:DNA-binding transcriptional LysR family regulator